MIHSLRHSMPVALSCLALINSGCKKDDNPAAPSTPKVNPIEPITRVELTLTPVFGGASIVAQMSDPDGRGPLPPTAQTTPINFLRNTVYNGRVRVFNDLTKPATDVTTEISEERESHRFSYTLINAPGITVSNFDRDTNNLNVGLRYDITVGNSGQSEPGALRIVLSHYSTVAKSTIDRLTPQTDVDVTFNFTVGQFTE